MKMFRSFSGILAFGAITAHLLLTAILFSSILVYVEQSHKDQFIDNVRTLSNMLVNQVTHNVNQNNELIEEFLEELLLSGNISFAEVELEDGTVYIPQEISNSEIEFKEDFYFSEHGDGTYFILAPIDANLVERSGYVKFGFDETIIQESIDTAYARGVFLAVGYFVLVIGLILFFIPRLTSSLQLLKNSAQKISSGNRHESLKIRSKIDDFNSLFKSLERMRLTMVSERKKVERNEVYIRRIMDRMADAMIVMNEKMIIQSLNSSAEDIFGYQLEEMVGKSFESFLSPCGVNASCQNCDELRMKANSKQYDASIECQARRKNGQIFPIELYYSNFNYENEHIIICNAHDMTERKKEKEKLTSALADAEDANKAKSDFLSSMSHELRTPLNAIIGYSEILLEEAEDNKDQSTANDLTKIRNSGTHLLSLINNVLDLSKIEAGKMELDNQEFLVSQVIEDVVFTITPLVEKNCNKFTLNFSDKDLKMYSDFTKIKQALINLIGNATKFTKDGDITLNVKIAQKSSIDFIVFDVIDSGIGIAEEDIGKLFKEFSQANSAVTTNYGGTGLGLIISRTFCQMMGGDILVTSVIGEGSTFSVSLPVYFKG